MQPVFKPLPVRVGIKRMLEETVEAQDGPPLKLNPPPTTPDSTERPFSRKAIHESVKETQRYYDALFASQDAERVRARRVRALALPPAALCHPSKVVYGKIAPDVGSDEEAGPPMPGSGSELYVGNADVHLSSPSSSLALVSDPGARHPHRTVRLTKAEMRTSPDATWSWTLTPLVTCLCPLFLMPWSSLFHPHQLARCPSAIADR